MSGGGHGHEDHGGHGGGGGSDAIGEWAFGYCKEVGCAAHGVTNMIYTTFLGIFGGGGGGGGHDSHGHH